MSDYVQVFISKDTDGEGSLQVLFDAPDKVQPIGFRIVRPEPNSEPEYWLRPDQIEALLKGVAEAAGTKVPQIVSASSISFNETQIRAAAAHNRCVRFTYAKGEGGVIESRRLFPEKVMDVGDHLTFVGYDPDREDVRAYRVDRIKGDVYPA